MDGKPTGNLRVMDTKVTYQDKHMIEVEIFFRDDCDKIWSIKEKRFRFDMTKEE